MIWGGLLRTRLLSAGLIGAALVCAVTIGVLLIERARLTGWAEQACIAAGQSFAQKGQARGATCLAEIQRLDKFETDTLFASNEVLAKTQERRVRKTRDDVTLARTEAQARDAALTKVEAANAAIDQTNTVAGDYFGALNELAGLPAPARNGR